MGKRARDRLRGGLADFRADSDFDPRQLRMGIRVEREHTRDWRLAKEIAKDHLAEIPDYYTRLAKMERSAMRCRNPSKPNFGKVRISTKDPATMTASQIKSEHARLWKMYDKVNDAFIAQGRGHERYSDYRNKTDALSMAAKRVSSRLSDLMYEVEARTGSHYLWQLRGGARVKKGRK